jgi:hypothetical protein
VEHGEAVGKARGETRGPRIERPVLEGAPTRMTAGPSPDRSKAIVVPSYEVTVSMPTPVVGVSAASPTMVAATSGAVDRA